MVPLFIGLVRVTGPFFYFGEFEQPTRRVRDAIYTPLPVIPYGRYHGSPPPHGFPLPCLNAVIRKPSPVIKGISGEIYCHIAQIFLFCPVFILGTP